MKSSLLLFFLLSPILAKPFLGTLFGPRKDASESNISDLRDKSKAELQLADDGQDDPAEGEAVKPSPSAEMGQKFQLYGRLFGNFIGALQHGFGDSPRGASQLKSARQRVHLSSGQEQNKEQNSSREAAAREIDAEEVTEKATLEGLRERKLIFLTTNVLPNLVSVWRSVVEAFNPSNGELEDLQEEKTEAMEMQRLRLALGYLPTMENSWATLGRVIKKSFGGEMPQKSDKLEESPPKVNAFLMLELFGSIFGITWNVLSQIGGLLRN